jgi:hypothetical protein
MIHILMMIRDKSLSMKMGDLLSLISDDILNKGLFGDDDSGFYTDEGILNDDDMKDLDILTERDWIPFHSDMISNNSYGLS